MSLDIYLRCSCCQSNIMNENFTHNVLNMWIKAGCYEVLYESEGKKAKEITTILFLALKDFCINFPEYQALDSPNGWGTAKHAIGFLFKVWRACDQNPEAIIHISA